MKKLILIVLVAAVLFGGFFDDDAAQPDGEAASYVSDGYYGATYRRPAVATVNRATSHWAQELVEGYRLPHVKDAPTSLAPSQLPASCSLPRPSSNAQIVFVEIYSGYDDAPLHFVSRKSIEALERYRTGNDQTSKREPVLSIDSAQQVDVFVTEVERPIYLVLAAYDPTIWSLQVAEGVRLDGIAVMGYGPQAIAHAPDNARLAFAISDQSPQSRCAVMPQRPVNATWTSVEIAQTDPNRRGFQRRIDDARQEHRRHRDWLQGRVGHPHITIDAYRTSHVLIGPKPTVPLTYRSLEGAPLIFTPTATPVWADLDDVEDAIDRMLAGGS